MTVITKAVYEPLSNRITFFADDKILYGFCGSIAHQHMLKVLLNKDIELIFKDTTDMETKKLIKQMHAILAAKGIMDMKLEILEKYNVSSSKDLTYEQLTELIANLNKVDSSDAIRHNRSVVLCWLGKLGIKGGAIEGWDAVNNYLVQPRISGKVLYAMNVAELMNTTERLRMIYQKNQNRAQDIKRLEKLN
ncbi:MAG: hypothetical protein PHR79_05315 [Bacteroidales bacterium]|nr:hypothetical protein [Bacteroidales bacterium]